MIAETRRAKIIATLGPASQSREQIKELVEVGADLLRVNTSHLQPQQAADLYRTISEIQDSSLGSLALLVDLQGPKIRLGEIENQHLETGHEVMFCPQDQPGVIHFPLPGLHKMLAPGCEIVLGDGAPTLEVVAIEGLCVRARVLRAGSIRARMGAALPGCKLGLPALTSRDMQHLQSAADYADWFALSFVSCAEDVIQLRQALQQVGSHAKIMAKIERAGALDDLDRIIDHADAIMVARGDLGVEVGLAAVPFVQEDIVRACVEHAKPAVIATQVLESMTHSDLPTRAEASDVAQALVEGASALMLSAESATGEHPALAVRTLGELIRKVESHLDLDPIAVPEGMGPQASLVRAADQLAYDQGVGVMLIPTDSGRTAQLAANLARQHIVALCPDRRVARQLNLQRGVHPVHWDGEHGQYLPTTVLECATEAGILRPGRRVVVAWSQDQPQGPPIQLIAAIGGDHTNHASL